MWDSYWETQIHTGKHKHPTSTLILFNKQTNHIKPHEVESVTLARNLMHMNSIEQKTQIKSKWNLLEVEKFLK